MPRKPDAPARNDWTTYSSTSNVVSMTTRTADSSGSALIMRVAASPSVPGIRMSMSTTSGGRSARASSTARAPSAASPTTTMSGSESTGTRNALRRQGWSSASSTRIGAPRSSVTCAAAGFDAAAGLGASAGIGMGVGWVIGGSPSRPPFPAAPVLPCGVRREGSHGRGNRRRTRPRR
ncbi:hypothetical protein SCALM49S_03231 [Streptomyces californicus]